MRPFDIYDHVVSKPVGFAKEFTAGTTADDGVEVTGATIDTQDFHSAKLSIAFLTSLASGETLSFGVDIQESDDDSDWDTAEVVQADTVVATGTVSGENGVREYRIDLQGNGQARKRYVRFNITPTLSASGTDTVACAATCELAGNRVVTERTNPTTQE